MHQAYKFQLYPTKTQEKLLVQIAGNCRWVWNHMLAQQIVKYQQEKKFIFAVDMANQLPDLKQELSWLSITPSQSLQQVCIDQDKALKRVWKSKFGFPKFKSKSKSIDSFRIPQTNNQIKLTDSYIKLPKMTAIKYKKHRDIIGLVKSVTISRDIDRWFVSILVEVADITPAPINPATCKSIGIDLGIASFLIDNNGNKTDSPRFLKKKSARLKRYQRQVSKKQKNSKNRYKARIKLAKWHRAIRNARADWLHKLSNKLVTENELICVEDLKTKSLMKRKRNKSLNRAIADQGWGMFLSMLKYKTKQQGKTLTQSNQFDPSSKTCSCCGHKMAKLELEIREWQCPSCGTTHDRDTNAARNILFWGIMMTPNTAGMAGINACGDTSTRLGLAYVKSLEVSVNQEAVVPLGQQ
jgi:putative transposase